MLQINKSCKKNNNKQNITLQNVCYVNATFADHHQSKTKADKIDWNYYIFRQY